MSEGPATGIISDALFEQNSWQAKHISKLEAENTRLKKEQMEIATILDCPDRNEGIKTPSNLPNVIRDKVRIEIPRLKTVVNELVEAIERNQRMDSYGNTHVHTYDIQDQLTALKKLLPNKEN